MCNQKKHTQTPKKNPKFELPLKTNKDDYETINNKL